MTTQGAELMEEAKACVLKTHVLAFVSGILW